MGGIFGGPIGGWIADKFGRKAGLVHNAIPYLSGYFLILSVSVVSNDIVFKVLLIMGRFLTGVGFGWSFGLIGVGVTVE